MPDEMNKREVILTIREAGNSMHLRSYICFGATSSNPTSIGLLYADRSA